MKGNEAVDGWFDFLQSTVKIAFDCKIVDCTKELLKRSSLSQAISDGTTEETAQEMKQCASDSWNYAAIDLKGEGDGKSRKRKSVSPARNEPRGSYFKSHHREHATGKPGKLTCWPILCTET